MDFTWSLFIETDEAGEDAAELSVDWVEDGSFAFWKRNALKLLIFAE